MCVLCLFQVRLGFKWGKDYTNRNRASRGQSTPQEKRLVNISCDVASSTRFNCLDLQKKNFILTYLYF